MDRYKRARKSTDVSIETQQDTLDLRSSGSVLSLSGMSKMPSLGEQITKSGIDTAHALTVIVEIGIYRGTCVCFATSET